MQFFHSKPFNCCKANKDNGFKGFEHHFCPLSPIFIFSNFKVPVAKAMEIIKAATRLNEDANSTLVICLRINSFVNPKF
jgi:hypothetical protein